MSRAQILLISITHAFGMQAQSWCAPGAEWEFHFNSQGASGITYAHYVGDTMIDGLSAQRIDHTIYAVDPEWWGGPFTQELEPLFTRYADDVVWIWDQWAGTFDTLMWFGAVPGDRWLIPSEWPHGGYTVVDTGHFLLAGDMLRWVAVEEDIATYGPDTLWERIGFGATYLDPWQTAMIDFTTAQLKCYRDDSGYSFSGPWYSDPCLFTVGTGELTDQGSITLHPNPGTTQFTIALVPGPHTVALYDATGRCVLQERTMQERPVITIDHLPAGIYHVRVDDAPGTRWVKQ